MIVADDMPAFCEPERYRRACLRDERKLTASTIDEFPEIKVRRSGGHVGHDGKRESVGRVEQAERVCHVV